MEKRKIIKIDEKKCNGCGLCIPNCPEGAMQVIDGKARLISDLFCDGLGACIGHCPQDAITIVEREAGNYDETKVMENIIEQGRSTIIAHLKHLREHHQKDYLQQALDFLKKQNINIELSHDIWHPKVAGAAHACPGSRMMDFREEKPLKEEKAIFRVESQLRQWPVQLKLVPITAPYLQNADILIAADCVPFAYADFHEDLLKGKILLVGCPKLDDMRIYSEKLSNMLKNNSIKSITYAHMEVSCCFGLMDVIQSAIKATGRDIPFREVIISIKGKKIK